MGPIETLDRSFRVLRVSAGAVAMPAFAGGALLGTWLVGTYYLERVEGVTGLRPVLAAGLVLAWWGRCLLLVRATREAVLRTFPHPVAEPRSADILRTASVVALGLWPWAWMLVAASLVGPIGIALVVPLMTLRGAVAPSWPACAGCAAGAGFSAFWRSTSDTSGRRVSALLSEGLLVLALYPALINVFAVIAFGVLVARTMFGLDVALAEQFLSPGNTFVLVLTAAGAFTLFEPVRAARAAVLWVDARQRREGLDLTAAVDAALASSVRRGRGIAATVLLVFASAAGTATAQEVPEVQNPPQSTQGAAPVGEQAVSDGRVRQEVSDILADQAFREVDGRGEGVQRFLGRLWAWLVEQLRGEELPEVDGVKPFAVPLPPPWVFLVLAGLLLATVATYLVRTGVRAQREDATATTAEMSSDPRNRPPAEHLDDASQLANQGSYRLALRALYLATLVALDRRRLIVFEPSRTNWQYLRDMPRTDVRQLFQDFTRLFDHKWYGDEPTTDDDYQQGRALADRICGPEQLP